MKNLLIKIIIKSVVYLQQNYTLLIQRITFSLLLLILGRVLMAQDFLPCSPTEQLVFHQSYTLNYSEAHEQAEWVYYELSSDKLKVEKTKRKDNFKADPKVETGSAAVADYKKSGYDRGHLAPAADMAFDVTAMSESFYMSNICPQVPAFNRGIWKGLEMLVRAWVNDSTKLYIATGPILVDQLAVIGVNNVCVPNFFYKAVLRFDYINNVYAAIAFLIPNEGSKNSLIEYIVTIDALESLTGIDFYPELPDELESQIEMYVDDTNWSGIIFPDN